MHNPFRYFNSSPEVIRLAVMMYVRYPLSLRQVEARISDLAMVLYRQDQSPRLDFWGSDVRSHTT